MIRLTRCALIVLLTGGCAGPQLRESAVDMGPAFGSLQERQILVNLSSLIKKPWSIPGQIDVTTGSLQIQNQASLSWKVPISSTGHEADPSAQSQEQDSFTFTPVTDGDDLRRVRALYRYAICANGSEFANDWEETIRPYEEALQKTSLISALPIDQAEIRRIDNQLASVNSRIVLQTRRLNDAKKALQSHTDSEKPSEFQGLNKDAATLSMEAAKQSTEASAALVELSKTKSSLEAQKKTAQAKANSKDKDTGSKNNDQNGPPDSVQLERAKEQMVVKSLGKSRFLYWTDEGSETSKFVACSGQNSAETSSLNTHRAYHLGTYGGLDLWTDSPERFSKFMMLVIGSTPNTTGIHALTLGIPGNAPPKVQNSTPTLRILGGVL